eukprot:gene8309-8494_t
MSTPPTPNKIFVGGLSWETNDQKLRAYFENFGSVLEAFVSYDRQSGRPRGFGFVVFDSAQVAEKVVASKHMIDKREVEAKRAVPKEDNPTPSQPSDAAQRTKKIFVGGLAPSVDEQVLRQYFEAFGQVDDAVVMYDHDNKRPRGFGFITFTEEESVDKVFAHGAMQIIHDKHIEIKPAVPKDQMAQQPRRAPPFYSGRSIPAVAAAAAASNFAGRPPYGYRQGLQAPYTQRPYPQGLPSPRAPITGSIGPVAGYGSSSPQGRAAGGPAGAAYGSGIAVQYAPQVPGPASRYSASGMAGAGSSRGFPGVSGQQFGARMYGGLGFGADPVAHLPGTSPLGTTPEFATFGAGAAVAWGT